MDMSDKKSIPEWASKVFARYLDETEKLYDLFRISTRGIATLRGMPGIIKLLAEVDSVDEIQDPKKTEENKKKFEIATREAELAKKEVDNNFPLLHAQALVTIWTLLEASVMEFLEAWIKNQPGAIQIDQIQDLRIRLGEYERQTGDGRFAFIIEQLEQKYARENVRYGYERFEKLLSLFDLSSDIPPKLHKELVECVQVRNCIVHKAGIVDAQLLRTCPWLPYKIGNQIIVDGKKLERYYNATTSYITIMICRVGQNCGIDMHESLDKTTDRWIQMPEGS
jgi:hypothetical protein